MGGSLRGRRSLLPIRSLYVGTGTGFRLILGSIAIFAVTYHAKKGLHRSDKQSMYRPGRDIDGTI